MNQVESLRAFVAAVDAGSLSGAARALAMPLPTLSRKVADLEAHVGTPLLVRTSRKLEITDAGQAYVVTARRVLDELADADRAARGELTEPRGELAIAAPLVFGRLHVLPIVSELLRQFPEIRARLVLSDSVASLVEDHFDVAIRIGELSDSSLIATRVGSVRRVVCASAAYLAEHGRPKKPADLADHATIAVDALAWKFGKARVEVRPRLVVNTAEAAVDAATAGLGITRVLSYQMRDLKPLLVAFESSPLPVHLVRATSAVPRKVRAFWDLAAARIERIL